MKRVLSFLVLAVLFLSIMTSGIQQAFKIQPVKAQGGTIYIRADGSIDPPSAPISTLDNITYTFTSDIYEGIAVEREGITIDGAGYKLEDTGVHTIMYGIQIWDKGNMTIRNTLISSFRVCIMLINSSNNIVSGNKITNGMIGINIAGYGEIFPNSGSSNNTITGNNITANEDGVDLRFYCCNNTISGNSITENIGVWGGISLMEDCDNNAIIGNKIKGNSAYGIYIFLSSNNIVSGNDLMENNVVSIALSDGTLNNIIQDNNVTATELHYGITLKGAYNIISGNNITKNEYGIALYGSNNTFTGNNIANNDYGIFFDGANNNTVNGNNITANSLCGIVLHDAGNIQVSGNNLTNNDDGIWLNGATNSTVSGNNLINNGVGMRLEFSFNNAIYHNNFFNNTIQASNYNSTTNVWDSGYPSGGNYWSDYTGTDVKKGPLQDQAGADGIGDTPYNTGMERTDKDNYPFMTIMFNQTGVSSDFTGTVLTIDGTPYTFSQLPVSFMWSPASTHSFTYQSPLEVAANSKRYVWDNTTGLFTSQSETSITVPIHGSVTGNYKTQHRLTVVTDPSGLSPQPTRNPAGEAGSANSWWYDASTSVQLTTQSVTGYTFSYWDVDAVSQGNGVNQINVGMSAPHTATAHHTSLGPQNHDVAVTKITLSKTVVDQTYSMYINVTVQNQGDFDETFSVSLYANATIISSKSVSLAKGASTILTFKWDTTGWSKGSYKIKAVAQTVPGETDTSDNTLIDGTVLVSIPGDINGDKRVDYTDLLLMMQAMLRDYFRLSWNPNADINNDGHADYRDWAILLRYMGQRWY